MDFAAVKPVAEWLAATAPWGFVALLSWGFWRINQQKDKQLIDMHERLIDIAETQVGATVRMESALQALKSAIEGLARR
ncbi:MAG: hypothetical protein GY854_33670 [Deltaproteobacteria bacterium]|nr:hypothetical protein [Deltaproteobacteria bacterium]